MKHDTSYASYPAITDRMIVSLIDLLGRDSFAPDLADILEQHFGHAHFHIFLYRDKLAPAALASRPNPTAVESTVQARWSELADMDRSALRVAWRGAFDNAPPHFLSMTLMRKALIWYAQCRRFGGLSPDMKRALNSSSTGKTVRSTTAAIRPGTQLVREWNGRRYQVDVSDDGYVMNGERFKSLSAIALHITGTSWSGPRFFGLNGKSGGGA